MKAFGVMVCTLIATANILNYVAKIIGDVVTGIKDVTTGISDVVFAVCFFLSVNAHQPKPN